MIEAFFLNFRGINYFLGFISISFGRVSDMIIKIVCH